MRGEIDIRIFSPDEKEVTLEIGGLLRKCPLYGAGEDMWIVGNEHLSFGSDIEFTATIGEKLAEDLAGIGADCILTPETKSLGIAYEVAKNLGHPYFAVARKNLKPYNTHHLRIDIHSITSQKKESLYLDDLNIDRIRSRTIILLDDVISTCSTITGLMGLAEKAGAHVACLAAVWLEGPWPFRRFRNELRAGSLRYLDVLPVFARGETYDKLYAEKKALEK